MESDSNYIKPLDGLRAIAILAVLIFHLDKTYLPGGFVGVDIFFTISGFIITRNIVLKRQSGKRFSLIDFYHRRVLRLLPAVIATVLISLFAANFIYSSSKLEGLSEVGFLSIVSTSNIFFLFNLGYFDDSSSTNIFLHTWSLSVEEQFYLVWPVFLIVLYKFRNPLWIMLGVLILSTIIAYFLSIYQPLFAFYMMPARIFQFAIGAIIAIWGLSRKEGRATLLFNSFLTSNILWFVGMAAILISCWIADGKNYNFWTAALLPVSGAALTIASINAKSSRTLLASKIMRYIGQRAYSIYLVHWPLIVMSSVYLGNNKSIYVNVLLGVLSVLIGEIIFQSVEQRWRLKRSDTELQFKYKTAFGFLTIVGSLVAVHLFMVYNRQDGAVVQYGPESQSIVRFSRTDARNISVPYSTFTSLLWSERRKLGKIDVGCQLANGASFEDFNAEQCVPFNRNEDNILIIGDSFAPETLIALSKVFPQRSLLLAGGAGCSPIYPNPVWMISNMGEGCAELNSTRFQWIENDSVSAIVLATNWNDWNEVDIHTTLQKLKETQKPIIVFGVRPAFSEQVPAILDSAVGKKAASNLNPYFSVDPFERNKFISSIVQSYGENFRYIDVLEKLCGEFCEAFTEDGRFIYLDTAHIAAGAAETLGERIANENGKELNVFSNLKFSKTDEIKSIQFKFSDFKLSEDLDSRISLSKGTKLEPIAFGSLGIYKISGTTEDAQPSNIPEGLSIRLARESEEAFSGKRVRVDFRAAGSREGAKIGISYSTNEVGNSGWQEFNLGSDLQDYSFHYFVPPMNKGLGDFIGMRSYGSDAVVVDSISISVD